MEQKSGDHNAEESNLYSTDWHCLRSALLIFFDLLGLMSVLCCSCWCKGGLNLYPQLADIWTYMDLSVINTLPSTLMASKEVLEETVAPEKKTDLLLQICCLGVACGDRARTRSRKSKC